MLLETTRSFLLPAYYHYLRSTPFPRNTRKQISRTLAVGIVPLARGNFLSFIRRFPRSLVWHIKSIRPIVV